jgi:FKBP-type peptidyl-prolyl cis-trans isomerase SlyD
MAELATIMAGKVAVIEYVLTNGAGDLLDTSIGRAPLAYLHGHGNVVAGLEQALEGKQPGERVEVSVAPADGYGEKTGPGPQAVKKSQLPRGVRPVAGERFVAGGSGGAQVVLYITEARGSRVWVDTNHPLAGETLNFDVTVVAVRDATSAEIEHGHAHGPDGMGGHLH